MGTVLAMKAWKDIVVAIGEYYLAALRWGVLGVAAWYGAYVCVSFYLLMPLTGTMGEARRLSTGAEIIAAAVQSVTPMLISGLVTILASRRWVGADRSEMWGKIALLGMGTVAVKFIVLEGTNLFFYRRFAQSGGPWVIAGRESAELALWIGGGTLAWWVSIRRASESPVSDRYHERRRLDGPLRIWAVWLGCGILLAVTAGVLAVFVPVGSVLATVAVVVAPLAFLWVRSTRGVVADARARGLPALWLGVAVALTFPLGWGIYRLLWGRAGNSGDTRLGST